MELWGLLISGVGVAMVNMISSIIGLRMNHKNKQQQEKLQADRRYNAGVRVLLYDRIKHLGKDYIAQGYIHSEDLEDLMQMHKIYHDDLGGNGFLDSVMEQVKSLPIE